MDLVDCPVCSKKFPQAKIDQHVDACLNGTANDDDGKNDFDIYEKEPKIPKIEEMTDDDIFCQKCRSTNLEELIFLENCIHQMCRRCTLGMINQSIQEGDISEINCKCGKPLLQSEIKQLLGEEGFQNYLKAGLSKVMQGSDLVTCPNPECGESFERMKTEPKQYKEPIEEMTEEGKPMTIEALQHRDEFRFRCRKCDTIFCAKCKKLDYHLGKTCEQQQEFQEAKHCRFCDDALDEDNTAKPIPNSPGLNQVCTEDDCLEKRELVCPKILKCGHLCYGIKGFDCVDCLVCKEKEGNAQQKLDDYCNICWTDCLSAAPVVKLDCGHYFHFECAKAKIEKKWTGARIVFSFLDCPLCQTRMSCKALESHMKPMLDIYNEVKDLALKRLKYAGDEGHEQITSPNSKFYNNKEAFAIYNYSYFPCYKCSKPYFGGNRACEAVREFDPTELICGSCSDPGGLTSCTKHGNDYIEWKCKFCCKPSVWFCWGNTHFCEPCHQKAGQLPGTPRHLLPKCTCGMKHPENGEEYSFGCSLCRLEKLNN